MTIRLSQAFAAFRTATIAELMKNMQDELVPNFNAEVMHIEKKFEEDKAEHGETLAMHFRRSSVLDLKVKQQAFIKELDEELLKAMKKRISLPEYNGKLKTISIPGQPKSEGQKATEPKEVLEVEFPDGSSARVPKGLWIDYSVFQRI